MDVPGASLGVTVTVLAAATLHAVWNALAHAIEDQLVAFAWIGLAATACSLVVIPLVAVPAPGSRPFLGASAVLHVGYNLLLMRTYRIGEFNQVYPLARGTSPLVVAAVAVPAVGERLAGVQLLGVLVVSVGLASLVLAGGRPHPDQWPALLAALGTGLAIAAYTVADGIGVRRSGSPVGYTAWLFALQGPVVPLLALALRRSRLPGQLRPYAGIGLLAGGLSAAAYGLVLWAQTRGALAAVAALRETSVVIGAGIGARLFHERFGRARLVATLLVAGGIVLLNLG